MSRAEIEDYCAANGLEPRRDPSNFSPVAYTRNRVRLELLPLLAQEYNPAVSSALLRLSEIAARDADYLRVQADAALADATRERGVFRVVLDRATLAGLHPALLRHVLRQGIVSLRGTGEGIAYEHIERTCRAISAPMPRAFLLNLPYPPCTVRIADETLILTLANVPAALADVAVPLSVPGAAALPGTGWTARAGYDAFPGAVTLDADAVQEPLTLRNRRAGDRVDPLGMGGRHKRLATSSPTPRCRAPRGTAFPSSRTR